MGTVVPITKPAEVPVYSVVFGNTLQKNGWRNNSMTWDDLLDKLREPIRTEETVAEYKRMSRDEKLVAKDHGGFVAGRLKKNGRRTNGNIESRSMLTLDLDDCTQSMIVDIEVALPYELAIYSTHSHTPSNPRLRLVLPMTHEVSPDQYEAISRKVAETVGMSCFDSTTFQSTRQMFLPSCSKDGEYIFETQHDKLLDPDEWLAMYDDWRDTSEWPLHEKESKIIKTVNGKKKQDPTTRKGIVGRFCRAYTVPDAIDKFLSDLYEPSDDPNRYTYKHGESTKGLVIYDNGLFCYSHHDTDPAHGRELNAFELVQLHMFGEQDELAKPGTPYNRMPSYTEMKGLVENDVECIRLIGEEKRAELEDVFGDIIDATDDGWKMKLHTNQNGYEADLFNLQLILLKDENLSGIRYNELTRKYENNKPAPWFGGDGEWKDADTMGLCVYLGLNYVKFVDKDVNKMLDQIARSRSYHPIREYLDSLPEWDGVKRVDTLIIKYLGAEDNAYTREATHLWFLGALTRAYHPGTKFDYCITLTGDQGIGKSTFAAKIGVNWFTDSLTFDDMKDDKRGAEKIKSKWIVEIGELKGLRNTDVESVKSFLSATEDFYRPAYGKETERFQRGCVFIGTGNNTDFLRDTTGNRRFWPIQCTRKRAQTGPSAWDMTDEEIAQIWAEVKTWQGEKFEMSKEAKSLLELSLDDAAVVDDRLGIIADYLDTPITDNWDDLDANARRSYYLGGERGKVTRNIVSPIEVFCECWGREKDYADPKLTAPIRKSLEQLGWKKVKGVKRRGPYGPQRCYSRPEG